MLRLVKRDITYYSAVRADSWSLVAEVAWDDGDNPTLDDIIATASVAYIRDDGPGGLYAHEPSVVINSRTAIVRQRGGRDI